MSVNTFFLFIAVVILGCFALFVHLKSMNVGSIRFATYLMMWASLILAFGIIVLEIIKMVLKV